MDMRNVTDVVLLAFTQPATGFPSGTSGNRWSLSKYTYVQTIDIYIGEKLEKNIYIYSGTLSEGRRIIFGHFCHRLGHQ